MANRAYASIWTRDFSAEKLLERWREFLATVPFSATRPGFASLLVRAVDNSEAPVLEQDLRSGNHGAEVVTELAAAHMNEDAAFETEAFWDLWVWDAKSGRWELKSQPLTIICHAQEFDGCIWQDSGNFLIDAGFEHLFTGHAGLLGRGGDRREIPAEPAEQNFLAAMTLGENLQVYQDKTRENIRKLYDWMQRIEEALPVERFRLWSEGEENFEARMEEILAAR